ncbi:MAG: GTPase HflX, partial [Bacteroidia bacterium]|nr:GTPase HflX [Bacteroidia bacterium]
ISHPNFEDHINVVRQTLIDIGAGDKETILVFNKIDAFKYVKKDEDDLTPMTRENLSLEELKKTWMTNLNQTCVYISAINKENIVDFKKLVYDTVKKIHVVRFPYNNLFY